MHHPILSFPYSIFFYIHVSWCQLNCQELFLALSDKVTFLKIQICSGIFLDTRTFSRKRSVFIRSCFVIVKNLWTLTLTWQISTNMSNIKNVLLRFPHLGQQIFQILDNQDLNKCLKVSRYCKTFIEDQKFFWIRKIVQMTNIDIDIIDIDISRGVRSFRNLGGQEVTRRWAAQRRFLICRNNFLENLLKESNRKDIQEMHTVAKSKQQKSWHSNVFHFAFLCGQTEILEKTIQQFSI